MLKTILFGFATNGYVSLRELEDSCKEVNLRFMYLMDHEVHPIRLLDILSMRHSEILLRNYSVISNQKIFEKEHTDLQHFIY